MNNKIRNISHSKEAPASHEGKVGRVEGKKAETEIREKSQELIEGVSEVVEGAEIAETSGEIAEGIGEDRQQAPSSGGQKAQGIQAQKVIPMPSSIEIMRIQVSTQIKKEIRILEKEAVRMMRSSAGFHPFKLNKVVSKIRYLRDILSGLAYATAETLKEMWIKYVRGITT